MKPLFASTMIFVLAGMLQGCGQVQQSSCPGCPLSVTTSATTSPSTTIASPTPVPTPSTHYYTPVPTPTPTPTKGCVGTPTPCSDMTDQTTCTGATGCTWRAEGCDPYICTDIQDAATCNNARCTWNLICAGTATACNTFNDSVSCGRQAGCGWQADTSLCSGTATSCRLFQPPYDNSVADCKAQAGCGVPQACYKSDATAADCSIVTTEARCNVTNGCYYATEACIGTPQACENFATSAVCNATAGCSWQSSSP